MIALRAAFVGLATSLALAMGVLLLFLWPTNPPFWPVVFVPVIPTGALAVSWALPRRGGAASAALVGLIAGLVAGAVSAVVLYAAVTQGRPILNLVGILRAPPFHLGPYNWFGPVPWPLPLLVPLGAALSALQAWLYYVLLAEPDAGLRGALSNWIARRPATLRSKLLLGSLPLVAAIFVVGWVGFAAMEDMHTRLHSLELRTEWWSHLRTVQTAIQAERRLLDEVAAAPFPETLDRLRQLDAQVTTELAHLMDYPPHPILFQMGVERIRQEATALRPLVAAVSTPYATFSTRLQETADAYVAGDQARAAALAESLSPAQRDLDDGLGQLADELGRGLFATMLRMDADHHTSLIELALLILLFTTLAMLLAAVLARAIVRPIHAISRQLSFIGKGDFSQRVAVANADELGALATNLNHVTQELGQLYQQLETASRHKSEFLASMSHELRTPLNAILSYSQLIEEEAEELGHTHYLPDLQKIHAAGQHLLGVINDILDLSKIEAGRMELYLETFDVPALVGDVAAVVRPLAERNANALIVDCPDDLGTMHADLTKTRQALFNLLSNASKFTEHGTITLTVRRAAAAAGDWFTFAVADTGIGMTPAQVERLFQAFTQADASTTRKYGGTGLGLVISRHFCEAMGGDVSVTSEAGRGSTFTIWLPAVVGLESAPAVLTAAGTPAAEPLAPAPDAGPLVLAIDDDPTVHDLLRRFLQPEGYQVVGATSGEEGLRLARTLAPAAITLDVLMPHLDGWAVLAALKADPALAEIPVIMLTIVEERSLGYTLGTADYLTKPIARDHLLAVLAKHCEARAREVLVVEDDAATREMVRRTLAGDGWTVDEAPNGRVALERVAARRPALILLDLMMPEMDGVAFLAALRERPEWRTIPIVVLTARDLTAADRQSLNGHVSAIIQKGAYSRDELLAELRERLREVVRRPLAAGAP
jgi:signal transduction histidine kinase/DNA-binding response OmpR family regulator